MRTDAANKWGVYETSRRSVGDLCKLNLIMQSVELMA